MNPFIQPYQYNFLASQANILMNTHRSVNESSTVKTLRALTIEKIKLEFATGTAEELALLLEIEKVNKSQREIDNYLNLIQHYIIPFKAPSDAGLKKVFRKTKKLSMPHWDQLPLQNYSFYAWNDPGQQRKFIVLYLNGKLVGLDGLLEPTIQKGICAICHESSGVSLFTVKGKTSKDGNYKTKGNYICHNSDQCNQQLKRRTELEQFVTIVTKQ